MTGSKEIMPACGNACAYEAMSFSGYDRIKLIEAHQVDQSRGKTGATVYRLGTSITVTDEPIYSQLLNLPVEKGQTAPALKNAAGVSTFLNFKVHMRNSFQDVTKIAGLKYILGRE